MAYDQYIFHIHEGGKWDHKYRMIRFNPMLARQEALNEAKWSQCDVEYWETLSGKYGLGSVYVARPDGTVTVYETMDGKVIEKYA